MFKWIKSWFVKETKNIEHGAETDVVIIEARAGEVSNKVETVSEGFVQQAAVMTDDWVKNSQQTRYNHIKIYLKQIENDTSENAQITRIGLEKELKILSAVLDIKE